MQDINSDKILVTGANGHIGKSVIQTLLEKVKPEQIVALVRDEKKADALKEKGINISIGSYDDINSLDRAMHSVKKVLLVSGGESSNALQQHKNVVDAAKRGGIELISYTSRSLKDINTLTNQLMKRHFQTEDYIKESGMNYIIFRNALYMDVIPLFTGGEKVFDSGIYLPAGNGKVAFALRSEMGEAIANVLVNDNGVNKIYTLTGNEAYSFDNVAEALSKLSNKDVKYQDADKLSYETKMKEKGLPDVVIQKSLGFITDIKNGQEESVSNDLEKLLGRKPASLKDGLKILYNL